MAANRMIPNGTAALLLDKEILQAACPIRSYYNVPKTRGNWEIWRWADSTYYSYPPLIH